MDVEMAWHGQAMDVDRQNNALTDSQHGLKNSKSRTMRPPDPVLARHKKRRLQIP